MNQYHRPIILISECLGVKPVRYDGNIIYDNFIEILKKYVNIYPVCPEVGIGLGVPRNPLILYEESGQVDLIDPATRVAYTEKIRVFSERILRDLSIDGAILKSSSPSCGVGDAKVYGAARRVLRRADGVFTKVVKEVFSCIPVESEKRLYSYDVRVRFLTKIFSLAELRATLSSLKSSEELVDFHRKYKYLVMLHSQTALKNLGRLVASRKEYSLEYVAHRYRDEFVKALCRNPPQNSYVNVFTHIYGHLKEELKLSERKYVMDLIEKYKSGRESLRTVMTYFRGFIYRLENTYLAEQRFFSPYPEELDYLPQ
ncbi:MAG: DUF523 and DUF1722 domain-containing protein [Zestosphaera sp.]